MQAERGFRRGISNGFQFLLKKRKHFARSCRKTLPKTRCGSPCGAGISAPVVENGADTGQILRGVDAGARGILGDMYRNAMAMPQHAKLLQRFGDLERGTRKQRKLLQEAGAIAVDADVAQRMVRACLLYTSPSPRD